MFSPKKPPDQSKIRLPKASAPPEMSALHYLHEQATENRGREVELIWSEPDSVKSYSMGAKLEQGNHDPTWTLWEDDGQEGKLVWRFETSDFELINDVVCMLKKKEIAQPPAQQQASANPRDPFAGMAPPPPKSDPFAAAANQYNSTTSAPAQPASNQYTSTTSAPMQPKSPASSAGYQPGYFEQAPKPTKPTDIGEVTGGHRARTTGFVPPFAPTAQKDAETPYAPAPKRADQIDGNLEEMPVSTLLQSLAVNRVTGKLEILGEETVGDVYFESGIPKHAGTPSEYGDGAIKELITWEKGTFVFTPNQKTEMKSVQNPLDRIISEGIQLLDQKRHLKRAGLGYESYLILKHKNLSDTELKLMLTKGAPLDYDFQRDVYQYLKHKKTFTDLLRDKPMDSTKWSTLLFNFLSCGLVEIKPPDAIKGSALDFLGEARAQVEAISEAFIRPETGVFSYAALMYFMEYEYHRYEAYNYPMSLIVFELKKNRDEIGSMADLLSPQAASIAAMRIDLVKRPLDVLGHFEAVDYGLLLPNTTGSSAAFVANRILESLTATPLTKGVDRNSLILSFGVASLPADGEDLESLVYAAKEAKKRAKLGSFPIVLARNSKKNTNV